MFYYVLLSIPFVHVDKIECVSSVFYRFFQVVWLFLCQMNIKYATCMIFEFEHVVSPNLAENVQNLWLLDVLDVLGIFERRKHLALSVTVGSLLP